MRSRGVETEYKILALCPLCSDRSFDTRRLEATRRSCALELPDCSEARRWRDGDDGDTLPLVYAYCRAPQKSRRRLPTARRVMAMQVVRRVCSEAPAAAGTDPTPASPSRTPPRCTRWSKCSRTGRCCAAQAAPPSRLPGSGTGLTLSACAGATSPPAVGRWWCPSGSAWVISWRPQSRCCRRHAKRGQPHPSAILGPRQWGP